MSRQLDWYLPDEDSTLKAGGVLAASAHSAIVFLKGNLGMGKTALSRGVLQALGHVGKVKSPTYTLVEPYELPGERRVYHFDLYRLSDPEELEYLGIRDYFDHEALCLIEWPERGEGILHTPDLEIELQAELPGRRMKVAALTELGQKMIVEMENRWRSEGVVS